MIALNRVKIWLNSIKNFYGKIKTENESVAKIFASEGSDARVLRVNFVHDRLL